MRIPNPIYDVIFKYLMENIEIAKDILSALLGVDIIQLEIKPQELVTQTNSVVRISRMDFKATYKTATDELKMMLIELQRAKEGTEVPRFRRYLGNNYVKELEITNLLNQVETVSLPITAIYFLGYELEDVHVPVLKIQRIYKDVIKDEILPLTDNFVECLSHDLYIVQIPKLNMATQTELEQILDVFNVSKYKTDDKHFLEYTGATTNPKVARIVKYLNRAMQYDEIVEAMKVEDEVEEAINRAGRDAVAKERKAKEEAIKSREEAIKSREEALLKVKVEEEAKEEALLKAKVEEEAKEEALLKVKVEEEAKEEALQAKESALKQVEELKNQLEILKQNLK